MSEPLNRVAPILVLLWLCLPVAADDMSESEQDYLARIHENAIVIDTHSDFLDRSAIDGTGLDEDPPGAQTSLAKLEQGQVDAQFFSIFVPPAFAQYGFALRASELIQRLKQDVESHSNRIQMAYRVEDIVRLANSGKVSALMGIEAGHVIENDVEKLNEFYESGVRYMTLTWSNTNDWADSSGDLARWGGLNDLG